MSNLFELIKSAVFPPKCVICSDYTDFDECLCSKCREIWEEEKAEECNKCGKSHTKCTCLINNKGSGLFGVFHLAEYKKESVAGRLVYKLKNDHGPVKKFLANELYKRLFERNDFREAIITYVPRRKEAIKRNGCDQARELALELGKISEKEIHEFIVRRGKMAQKNLDSEKRYKNVKNSYFINEKTAELIKGKRIIIVDDIITTGATVSYIADLLIERGALSVSAVSVARRT